MTKEIYKYKNPSILTVRFANTVFILGILFSILIAVYAIYKISNFHWNNAFYYLCIFCSGIFAILFGLGLTRLSNGLKVNLSVLFVTVIVSVYGFETYLEFSRLQLHNQQVKQAIKKEVLAKQMGFSYDTRKKIEVLEDLIDSGIEAYPNVRPYMHIDTNGLTTNKGRIYPLGSISNITTIFANDSGYYPIIETDEHGFNNPKGLYKENKVDMVLTGDSFTAGYSVHSNENVSAVLRELGFSVINIGKGGNGPLIELAALKEYAEKLKPKIVLWMYFVNDFVNLKKEMKSSFLKKYLGENQFSQNLILRQEEIDNLLIEYVQVGGPREWEREMAIDKGRGMKNIILIRNLRTRINLPPPPKPTPIFKEILQKSKQMVSGWGGKMYFVYLPDIAQSYTSKYAHRKLLLQIEAELNIPVINIHTEVFEPHPDPLSLFPFRVGRHYTAEGYRLVAEAISKRLMDDGIIISKSNN